MDWKKTGRIDHFEFEMVRINYIDESKGFITGVVGGKLSFDYSSDLKVSGSLNVVDTNFVNTNRLIRVWYVVKADADAEEERFELCTCFGDMSSAKYENGKWNGTINLRSVLARYIDDKMWKNWTHSKGSNALWYFDQLVSKLKGAATRSGVSNSAFSSNVVYTVGESPMKIFKDIADKVGGEITCDTHGRMVLKKKYKHTSKAVQYTLPSGTYSVTLPGLTYEDTTKGSVNRYTVTYTYTNSSGKEKTLRGTATAEDSSLVSFNKQGRYITETETLDSLSDKTQTGIDKVAKNRLANASAVTKYWKFTSFYLPIVKYCLNGSVVRFKYGKLDIEGVVYSVDMDLSPGGMLDVTLLEVRRHASL